jgi:hypothetical protein
VRVRVGVRAKAKVNPR